MSKTVITLMVMTLCTPLTMTGDVRASGDTSSASSSTPIERPGEMYLPSDDPMSDLEDTLEAARKSDKLALVVMGANWCHDSRALAEQLQKQPLISNIEEHYETVFIDVGYLDKGKDVINSLGIPIYYATPTVLIVDPVSGKLVNANNRHQWGSAASISMDDALAYFQLMANIDLTSLRRKTEMSKQLQTLLAEIDTFEQQQADRLYAAYAVLGPMLEAYKTEKKKFSNKDWNEVRDFRLGVSTDVDNLRTEAIERVASGENDIRLQYPRYPAFSWEMGTSSS